MAPSPLNYSNPETLAEELIAKTDGKIRLAMPLGLGKAVTIANTLTERALQDSALELSIFTALTPERPTPDDPFGQRLLGPAQERLFGRYPALRYAELLRQQALPDNITVQEFFLLPGKWLGHPLAQQQYITANYTHALHYLLARRPNVIAQLLARDETGQLSLSCNTDITADLLALRREGKASFLFAGEINPNLPFMPGSAVIEAAEADLLLDEPDNAFELFSIPHQPVADSDHAIGWHVSRLVPDGGTLQIGIGSIGDAVAHALRLRHEAPDTHAQLALNCPFAAPTPEDHHGRFKRGLYSATEMLVEGLLMLFETGIICQNRNGASIHAGFFLDSRGFYQRLREMPVQQRAQIDMRAVSYTNALYGSEAKKRAARRDARFINSTMKVTALGAALSDTLEDGQVVSGVGGQYNFVEQAFALEGARSILTLPATRRRKGRLQSNIVWACPTETIPRHLRDIIVTEYGVADLRGQSDAEAIKAMIRICDARFQEQLAQQARRAGKLPEDWPVPTSWKNNLPHHLKNWLDGARDNLPRFPLGTDFTAVEQDILPALEWLRAYQGAVIPMLRAVWRGGGPVTEHEAKMLTRMALDKPGSVMEFLLRRLLTGALRLA